MRRALVVLVVLALQQVGTPGVAQGPPSWPTFQGNREHTGYVPVTLAPKRFEVMWSRALSARPLNPVAAAGGKVFATPYVYYQDVEHLFALRAATGEVLWTEQFGAVYSVNPPAYGYGNVYVQVGRGTSAPPQPILHAFDGETGEMVYEQPFEAQSNRYYAPTVVDGVVYANGGWYGGLYAFDAFQPAVLWHTELNPSDEWTPAVDDQYAYAYTGASSARLSIVDRATGVEVSSIPDPNFVWGGWSMRLAPVLGRHDDVIAIEVGRLVSFDLASGTIRFEMPYGYYTGQPSIAHDRIFAIQSGALSVRDEVTGAYRWGWGTVEQLAGTMIVTDRHVIARSASATYAVDLETHEEVWSVPVSGHLAWSEGVLYLAGEDGILTAIRAPDTFLFRNGFESGDTGAWTATLP